MKIFKRVFSYIFFSNTRIRVKINMLISLKKKKKHKILRCIIQEQLRKNYHIIIAENAIVGSIILPHPHNVLIGRYARIGNNCKIYHDVTIGQNLGFFPKIGDNVIIYTGAKIIGNVTIGDNAIIGANAVVTSDVPNNAVVAGIPAKVIRYRSEHDQFY